MCKGGSTSACRCLMWTHLELVSFCSSPSEDDDDEGDGPVGAAE